ncbi:hypothetical protein [Dishui Lake virophage 2]|nr:hypothetical protein [Dishui Lake virophage 2]
MINQFAVFGERCSGTTYLEELLHSNFGLPITDKFGLKHFWKMTDFEDSNTTLFIGIERELLSWLDSFAKTPHQVVPYKPLDYQALFFSPIVSYIGKDVVEKWDNIMECRTQKSQIIHFLLPNLVKNYYFISYEDLVADPIGFLEKLREQFGLIPIKPFENWEYYKREKTLYKKKPIIIPPEVIQQLKITYPNHFEL